MENNELDIVSLKKQMGILPCGALGTVVYVHNGGEGFEVEFIKEGKTIALLTLDLDEVEKYIFPPLLSHCSDLDPKLNATRIFDERMAA